jgi:hypothetical protein
MALLAIDSLAPGMKTRRDVATTSGQVLMCAGAEITEKHIRLLRTWGIHQVDIDGQGAPRADDDPSAKISPALLQKARETVAGRFQHTDTAHPAIAELMRLAVLNELRQPESPS